MKEEVLQMPHKLSLNERSNLTLTGVLEVVSFDENTVVMKTCLGTLIVQGSNLQLNKLSLEGGEARVDGSIAALIYEETRAPGGLWRKLLG